ncbi:radical SAM protein [archaeon]|nr:radical SAM protein [archaeon]MBL7057184.1 radical SAM protein [Candidatus Woesearchaeota archaeon]
MKIAIRKAKSIITKSNLPDADYVINPYVGCQHACIYCYADFMKRFTDHTDDEWGKFVDIKEFDGLNIKPEKLNEKSVLISSVTDPYQPVEAKYKATRQILKKLSGTKARIDILTKSALVQRDIDLLQTFENLRVGISMNTTNPELSKALEPFGATPIARLKALKKVHEAGIETYLFISPFFPGISDYRTIIEQVGSSADTILFENINIRLNNTRKVFAFLKKFKPKLVPMYQQLKQYPERWDPIEKEIKDYCVTNNISHKIYFHHGGFK